MTHPTIDELLAHDAASLAHLASCASCRRLATLAGVEAPAGPAPDALPVVDRALRPDPAPDGDVGPGSRDPRLAVIP